MLFTTDRKEGQSTEIGEWPRVDRQDGWRQHCGGPVPILVVYFLLAFYHIGQQSLWVDEIFSLRDASPGGPFFTPAIWFKGQGPLYFVFLRLWTELGTSEAALRSLSVLFGGVAVCLTYAIGLRACNRRVAKIAAVLLATSPFFIWYSQEVRYITLMTAASLLAMYTFQRVLLVGRPGRWVSYGCSLVLALAAFVSNILLPVAQGLYLLCLPARRPVLRKWVLCQISVFLLFAWWANEGYFLNLGGYWQRLYVEITTDREDLSSIAPTERLSSGRSKGPVLAALPYTFFAFSSGFSLGPSLRDLHVSRSLATLTPHLPILLFLSALFGGLFFVGLTALRRHRDTGVFLLLWLTVPLIGAFGISTLTGMAYNIRYVSTALPAYILILAVGIDKFRWPVIRTVLLAAVLFVHSLSLANYYFDPRYAREDARSAARYLELAAQPQDLIVTIGPATPLQYYYRGELPIMWWRGSLRNADQSTVIQRLYELKKSHDRLWLVEIRPWERDPKGKVRAALDQECAIIQHQRFAGIGIYSYDLRKCRRFSTLTASD